MSEEELDFLYWILMDYCENLARCDKTTQNRINKIYKKITKLSEETR